MKLKKILLTSIICLALAFTVFSVSFSFGKVTFANAETEITKEVAFSNLIEKTYLLFDKSYTLTITGNDASDGVFTVSTSDGQSKSVDVYKLGFTVDETLCFSSLGGIKFTFSLDYSSVVITFGSVAYQFYNGTYRLLVEHPREEYCLVAGHYGYYECGETYFTDDTTIGDAQALAEWLSEEGEGYLPPDGHRYLFPLDEWDGNQVTLTCPCVRDGCDYEETKTATGTYVQDSPATLTENEIGHYSVTLEELWPFDGTYNSESFETVPLITGIAVKSNPTKVQYTVGEDLDLTGAVITVSYDRGPTRDVQVTEQMVSGFDSTTEGQKTLIVTYQGKTTTISANVVAVADEQPDTSLSGGAIAGIAVGSTAGVCLITYVTMFGIFLKTNKGPKFLIKSFETLAKLFKK